MLFSHIGVLDDKLGYQADRFVAVRDDRIVSIGDTAPEGDWGEVFDGRGKLLMEGLFDAHAHAPMTLLRGYAEGLPLQRWLFEKIFPFEAKITDEYARPATDLAIAEMLRFGIVSFSDMYFFDDARAQAVIDSGIKCNLCRSISVFDPEVRYRDTDFFKQNTHLIDAYHGAADGRLLVDLCIHSEYTTTPRIVEGLADHARETGLGIQLHLSETRTEHEECKGRHDGLTPAAYLEKLGIFDSRVTAAHCVWLEPDDMDILARHDATVASCPASNLKLGSGVADDIALSTHGVRIALGTDGVASNNATDMFRDMYLLAIAHTGVAHDPAGISTQQVLTAATRNGAYTQGRGADCGVLRAGGKADLIVLDVDVPWMQPVTEMCNNVVYSANGSEVCLTMVDGKVLYRDGVWPTIDVERAMHDTQAAHDAIVAEL